MIAGKDLSLPPVRSDGLHHETWLAVQVNQSLLNHGRLPKVRFGSGSVLPLHGRGVRSVQSVPRRTIITPRQSGLRRGIDDVLDRRLQYLPRRPPPAHHRADDQAHDRRRGKEQYAHGQLRRGDEGGARCVRSLLDCRWSPDLKFDRSVDLTFNFASNKPISPNHSNTAVQA